jgi:hypothetical protein
MRLLGFLTAATFIIGGAVIYSIISTILDDSEDVYSKDSVWEAFNSV